MINNKLYYLEIFKVSEENLHSLAAECLSHGGDYADLYFENTYYDELMLMDGEVSSGGSHVDYGVGIRVLKGEKTGYAYSESTQIASMMNAAKAAAAIAGNVGNVDGERALRDSRDQAATYATVGNNGDHRVRVFFNGEPNPCADRYPIVTDWRECRASTFLRLRPS